MTAQELEWLYEQASQSQTVAEIGSYQGRSAHALLSAGPQVTAVDHFRGSPEHGLGRLDDPLYRAFHGNVGHFPNLNVMRMESLTAAAMFADAAFDMVFIDADHSYEQVRADILAWRGKARRLLCGHDYHPTWPGVMRAVEEMGAFHTVNTIWFRL
jgi:Methyltransferase domain